MILVSIVGVGCDNWKVRRRNWQDWNSVAPLQRCIGQIISVVLLGTISGSWFSGNLKSPCPNPLLPFRIFPTHSSGHKMPNVPHTMQRRKFTKVHFLATFPSRQRFIMGQFEFGNGRYVFWRENVFGCCRCSVALQRNEHPLCISVALLDRWKSIDQGNIWNGGNRQGK